MLSIKALASLLALSSIVVAVPHPPADLPTPVCGTCNPLSGQNDCHPTTSCINTGKNFHCACRAGYKVKAHDNNITKHFRLPFENYEFLVFADPGEKCDKLCDDWTLPPPALCSEVKMQDHCKA